MDTSEAGFSEQTCDRCGQAVEELTRRLKAAQSRCADMARYAPQRGEVKRLRAQRDAVLALHRRCPTVPGGDGPVDCAECLDPWPCDTVKALGVTTPIPARSERVSTAK